jgi:signal transduction histidine kinase
MKERPITLSQSYAAALRKHLLQGPRASLRSALALGRQAVTQGLETLDLARIHEQAVLMLGFPKTKNPSTTLALNFFNTANAPIEETHRAARQHGTNLSRLTEKLGQRTEELAATHRQLQRVVVRQKVMHSDAEKSGRHYKQCLEESLQLQKRLRQLTHRVMAAQEDERTNLSHELQDEITQTLLGINVRLLSLKQHARSNIKGFKDEVASTQRLVLESARSVRRFAREIDYRQEVPNNPSK